MLVKQYVAKRSILTPGGKTYKDGEVIPTKELNPDGIYLMLKVGHIVDVVRDIPEENVAKATAGMVEIDEEVTDSGIPGKTEMVPVEESESKKKPSKKVAPKKGKKVR